MIRARTVLVFWLLLVGIASLAARLPEAVEQAEADAEPAIAGTWVNDQGSRMELQVEEGRLSGLYFTGLGEAGAETGFPLTGFVNGDLLVFCVDWGREIPTASASAWTAQLTETDGRPRLQALWHLVKDVPDEREAEELWSATLTGASVFTRPSSSASE